MQSKTLSAITVFAVAMAAGFLVGGRSWNGVIYLSDGTLNTSRNPAAIKRELDFSRLDGAELITATQKRLVAAAKVVLHGDQIGLELGHFVTRGPDGQRRLACDDFYDRLTLTFEAEGMASAGEKPRMEVDGPCQTSNTNIASIAPIWIPVAKILGNKAVDMDLDFKEGVKFRFSNLHGDWPVRWSLDSIRLYSESETHRTIAINAIELREIRRSPLVIDWMEARRRPTSSPSAKKSK